MRRLFLDEEHRYLLNTLYLNDYSIWLQTECQSKWLTSLIDPMRHMIDCELDVDKLGLLNGEGKALLWKVNVHEISDSDDEEDQQQQT